VSVPTTLSNLQRRDALAQIFHANLGYYAPAPNRRVLSDAFVWCLSDVWRLSVAYIGPKSRTERAQEDQNRHKSSPRHTWLGHHCQGQTVTPLSISNGERSRSPGRFAHRSVGASGGCSGERGDVLAVGNCCYVASARRRKALRRPRGRRGAGISWRPPAYRLLFSYRMTKFGGVTRQ